MPISVASRPVPCRRPAPPLTRKACSSTTSSWWTRAGSGSRNSSKYSPPAPIRFAIPARTSPICRPRSPPTLKGVQELQAHGGALRAGSGQRLYAARPGQRRGTGTAGAGPAEGWRVRLRNGRRRHRSGWPSASTVRQRDRDGGLHRHLAAAGPAISMRRPAVCQGGGTLRIPHPGGGDIPLNAGCLKPIEIVIPEGCLLNPRYPAAVVAGNVETSQCITDALYGALGVMAASQGTMKTLLSAIRATNTTKRSAGAAAPDRVSTVLQPCTPT